jgi:hypothetical protein
MDVAKPYTCIWFGDIHGPKAYEFIGSPVTIISHTPAFRGPNYKYMQQKALRRTGYTWDSRSRVPGVPTTLVNPCSGCSRYPGTPVSHAGLVHVAILTEPRIPTWRRLGHVHIRAGGRAAGAGFVPILATNLVRSTKIGSKLAPEGRPGGRSCTASSGNSGHITQIF